ncbi:MAG: phosphate ABC transporter permease subunit PstC [Candidatus Aminicenantia bacterium]
MFERIFRSVLSLSVIIIIILIFSIFLTLTLNSSLSLKVFGLKFLFGKTWDPVFNEFGALPFLIGTLLTSFLALLISIPFSLSISIFLGEYLREGIISSLLKSFIELLAGIPSIIYGFWGLFVLVPAIRFIQFKLGITPYGVGILTASIILSIMIIPYSSSIGREVLGLVPSEIKDAAYSLGATRYEVIRKVILPYAHSGILSGILLSLGRALGETMAVTMVIGNSNSLPKNIFYPSNTMASVIANEFTEATGDLYLSALVEIGLTLFLVTFGINYIGRYIIRKYKVA